MESLSTQTEEMQRKELIERLKSTGVEYQCGNFLIRFQLTTKSMNSGNTKESGEIRMSDHGIQVAHLAFSVSTDEGITFIKNMGYGKYEYANSEIDNSQDLKKKYSKSGIIRKAASLLAEYGIVKQTALLSGVIDPHNADAINSLLHMERTIGNKPFIHTWGQDDDSSEFHTQLRM